MNINKTGSGEGQVKLNNSPIALPFTQSYSSSSAISLTAVPSAGSSFTGWGGNLTGTVNPATLQMNGNKNVTATFKRILNAELAPIPPIAKLSLTSSGLGSGQVKINSQLSSFPVEMDFVTGYKVTIEAVPGANTIFKGWSGDISGGNPVTIKMSQSKKAVVNFGPKPIMSPVKPLSQPKLPVKK